jgi:hypothetical protein
MKIYDFKQDCVYENNSSRRKDWFLAIYSTLKEQGLFPRIPRQTTQEIVCNAFGLGDKYIEVANKLDERIKSDAKRYSIIKEAALGLDTANIGDQILQAANEKQSTLGAESEIKESGLNPVTRVLDQNSTETVSLLGFERSTRLSRDSSLKNHRKVYESLDQLSDEDLSVLSQVIQKTGEVTVPSSVADLLRELKSELSSIAPLQRQALVDTSIQVKNVFLRTFQLRSQRRMLKTENFNLLIGSRCP